MAFFERRNLGCMPVLCHHSFGTDMLAGRQHLRWTSSNGDTIGCPSSEDLQGWEARFQAVACGETFIFCSLAGSGCRAQGPGSIPMSAQQCIKMKPPCKPGSSHWCPSCNTSVKLLASCSLGALSCLPCVLRWSVPSCATMSSGPSM